MKRIRVILCSVLLFCIANLCCFTAGAAAVLPEDYNPDENCSLSITLAVPSAKPIPVAGAEIEIFHVADMSVVNGKLKFTFTDDFEDGGFYLNSYSVYDEDLAADIALYTKEEGIKGIAGVTDDDGKLVYSNLRTGIYLCTETKSPAEYSLFDPFLISIPEAAGNEWDYNVVAAPKIEAKRVTDISVSKEWNDNGEDRPKNITVQLLKGESVCDTVILSEENSWSYEWKDLPYGEDWNVVEVNVPDGYTVTYSNEGFVFNITNTQKLIQTGQLKWPIPIFACAGLALIICGFMIRGSGKKSEKVK